MKKWAIASQLWPWSASSQSWDNEKKKAWENEGTLDSGIRVPGAWGGNAAFMDTSWRPANTQRTDDDSELKRNSVPVFSGRTESFLTAAVEEGRKCFLRFSTRCNDPVAPFSREVNWRWGIQLRHTPTLTGDVWGEVWIKYWVWSEGSQKIKYIWLYMREIREYNITFLQFKMTMLCLPAKVRIPLLSKNQGNNFFPPQSTKNNMWEGATHSQHTDRKKPQNGSLASVCCTSLCLAVVGDEERATSMWGFHSKWKVELQKRAMTERSKGRSSSGGRPEGCISMETLSEENTYMKEQTAAGLTCHEFVTRITRSAPLNKGCKWSIHSLTVR